MSGARPAHGAGGARGATPALALLAALAYASFGTVFQVLPPFFDDLGRELGVGPTPTGLSMTFIGLLNLGAAGRVRKGSRRTARDGPAPGRPGAAGHRYGAVPPAGGLRVESPKGT